VEMQTADKRSYGMVASNQMSQREIATENGLISGHSYPVVSLFEFEDDGEEVCLVKLRNPWGYNTEWQGEWANNSPRWTLHLR